jgi:hypothetical protein
VIKQDFIARCELFKRAVKSLPVPEKHAEKHQLLYTYTDEAQIHLRGTALPMRYKYTEKVLLHLRHTATPWKTYENRYI